MTTQTPPKKPEDSEHLESQPTPRFPINKNPRGGVMDDQNRPSGDASDPRGPGPDKVVTPQDLKSAESSASRPSTGTIGAEEKGLMGKAGDTVGKGYTGNESPGRLQRLRGMFTRRRAAAGGGAVGVVVGGLIIFGVAQGPFQFVNAAQILQKLHFERNENFGNRRTMKMLQRALRDSGTERGRLGFIRNDVADKWEKELVDKTGLKPAYSQKTGRFVGFEIVDENKAANTLSDLNDNKKSQRLVEKSFGKGAEIKTQAEMGGRQEIRGTRGEPIDEKRRIVDLSNVSYGDRGSYIKTIGRATGTYKVTSAIGSRLLIKRGGVDFQPYKNVKRKTNDKLADWRAKIRQDAAERDKKGVKTPEEIRAASEDKDGDGTPETDPGAEKASAEGKELIAEADNQLQEGGGNGESRSKLKTNLARGAGGAAMIGVLCTVRSFGDDVENYKYVNNALPMMRMGMRVISMGNGVMSGKGFSLDELGAFQEAFYDKEAKTSFLSARNIQAGIGKKQTGPDIPREAKLANVGDKPAFFNVVDSIPFLGETCGISDGFFGLPVIKQVTSVVGDIAGAATDLALGLADTNTEELMGDALAAASGNSVNVFAKGAEFGNLANTGAFLAANEQAISMGGSALSERQVAQLREESRLLDKDDYSNQSFFARYVDVSNSSSLVSKFLNNSPKSGSEFVGSVSSSFSNAWRSFAGALPVLGSWVHAADSAYDYGMRTYGFSLDEEKQFDDPYENADYVVPRLDELNEKYGKCFGMKVTADDNGPHIQTDELGSEDAFNAFKLDAKKSGYEQCNNPNDEDLLRYRFYLADAQTGLSLACYYDDEDACSEIGAASPRRQGEADSSSSVSVDGTVQELAKRLVDSGKLSDQDGRYMSQIKALANGNGSCKINPTILKMLVGIIEEGHTITMSSLNRRCTGVLTASGSASYHYRDGGGHAVDVVSFDGQGTNGGNAASVNYLKLALKYIPSGSGVGQFQAGGCGASFDFPEGISNFADSCNHVHIQVPIEGAR